jgi:CxxC motif-containing protein (DUF1111 family)
MPPFQLSRVRLVTILGALFCGVIGFLGIAAAQTDPGPRPLPAGAGGPLSGLNSDEKAFFYAARTRFQEINSVVAGTIPGENSGGLGPRFNLNSCAGCHAFPTIGGSSPKTNPNPQATVAKLDGATNVVPSFIMPNGPIREARFVRKPDGTPDGGVHDLFVITGRIDAGSCDIKQPDFEDALANNNVIFRIPTPLFGLGLVENVPDNNLKAARYANAPIAASLGISGEFNRSANDGTITRFGWKAQNKSLLIFAGEAYNVEQGVTNEAFPNERETDPNCQFNALPEDTTNFVIGTSSVSPASDYASDVVNFAVFMRLSAAPVPVANSTSTRGGQVFQNIGCQACHITTQKTAQSAFTGQGNVSFSPLSDFAIHDMGTGLADGISQGNADGREFRTAPLWGIGQRFFFLHDGRTSDLNQAILNHASNGSEANTVISNFKQLSTADQQALLNFLRSL